MNGHAIRAGRSKKATALPDKIMIDYYFAPMSGYAYLGHARLFNIAVQAGAQVV
jgi:2-hydroxychromene-2-carboxylate isomerase